MGYPLFFSSTCNSLQSVGIRNEEDGARRFDEMDKDVDGKRRDEI
jgi:hypothetical protein